MKTHWAKQLKDAGKPIMFESQRQIEIMDKIANHNAEIEFLKQEYDRNETKIRNMVANHWNEKEIEQARKTADSWNNPK